MSYCRNCGTEIGENAAVCVKCGYKKGTGTTYCSHCGVATSEGQAVCTSCGYSLKGNDKISALSENFSRTSDGKIIGGVFAGLEKYRGINRWIGRIIFLVIPIWPLWVIIYIVACVAIPMET